MSTSFIIFPSDIANEQARTKATADEVNTAIGSCKSLDDATLAEWNTFYADVSAFCAKTPVVFPWPWQTNYILTTVDTGNTMLAYETELRAWQKRLASPALNCTAPVPDLATFDASPTNVQPWVDIAKYGAIIACAVGGAWVVSEVVSVVRAGQRALPEKREPEREPEREREPKQA